MKIKGQLLSSPEPEHKRVRALRRQLELSQLEVAIYAGISQSQYSLFEHGHACLDSDITKKIKEFLNVAETDASNATCSRAAANGQ